MGSAGLDVHWWLPLSVCLRRWSPSVQTSLRRVIKGVGGFDHAEWRAFRSERTKADARGFIDGDLIEQVCNHMLF